MQPLPNHHCPLCGEFNACAAATSGDFATHCWCTGVTIDPKVLAQVPEAQRNQACMCKRCATIENVNADTPQGH